MALCLVRGRGQSRIAESQRGERTGGDQKLIHLQFSPLV
jgi:hypothetical protein